MQITDQELATIQVEQDHFHRDVMYFQEHYAELLDRFPEQ